MLWLNVFLTSTTVIFNQFAEGGRIQTYDFVREPHKNFTTSQATRFVLFAPTKSFAQSIRCVTERHCL